MSGPAETSAPPPVRSSAGSNSGGFDLLRRATQAMMSRSVAADDDGVDHIGIETPRSGVATPQPDLHDKRLPGIMSYFGQVRAPSLKRLFPGPSNENARDATLSTSAAPQSADACDVSPPPEPVSNGPDQDSAHLPRGTTELSKEQDDQEHQPVHPYPTPPTSHRPSLQQHPSDGSSVPPRLLTSTLSREATAGRTNVSELTRGLAGGPSALAPMVSTVETLVEISGPTNVTDRHASNTSSLNRTVVTSGSGDASAMKSLKKLTCLTASKSGASTPARALSVTPPSNTEGPDDASRENGEASDSAVTEATDSSAPSPGQAPATKGKLKITILEARGLKKCRHPYVVAVFQRSELISGGPHVAEDDDDAAIAAVATGGIPIQRQGSDSGRPPMAIPMRSRQSSNTSIADHTIFRNRNARTSQTNPKWDAEAVFDVVGSDMLVDISVYDHGPSGEEFLGHVDLQAASESDVSVRGWYSLKGHIDTMAENTPTGELLVEVFYHKSERRHVGPQDFQILRLIGKGTFGQVYQVRKKDTKRVYAMKVLSKKVIVQKKEVAHTVGERNILVRTATSDSPFIVGLKFSFQTPSDLYLVTDYMSGGELFWHLQKEGRFDEKRAKFYIAELILAIEHLHKNDIVYRDLKPENILLDANGHIALCDFGLSKANLTKNDTTNTFCGTTEYLAPEVLLDEAGYTKMVDFWSLGVLVFEMCCGWSPFYADDTQQMYKNIAFGKVRFPRDTLSLDGRNFVKGLLNRNPKHRLGAVEDAQELKRHAFFADIDWDALSKRVITPPFRPQLKNETDVSYFDPEFTNAMSTNGSLNERAAALAQGYATSTPLSPSVQANFQGFTFVDESALDDHMKDRFGNEDDDQDMDDAERKKDEEWDDLNDIHPRNADRMSGIVKTAAGDDQMFGASNFEI